MMMQILYTNSPSLGCQMIWPPELDTDQVKAEAARFNDRGALVPCHVYSRDSQQVACAALGSFGPMGEPTTDAMMRAVLVLDSLTGKD